MNQYGFRFPKRRSGETRNVLILESRNSRNQIINGTVGHLSSSTNVQKFEKKEFVDKIFELINSCMLDYFDPGKKVDYFKQAIKDRCEKNQTPFVDQKKKYVPKIEKCWQHSLFFDMKNARNGLYAYDLEFSQRYPDKDFVERLAKKNKNPDINKVSAKSLKLEYGTNEPDLLAVEFKDGLPVALVLLEIKSTASACKGKSGIKKHMKQMYMYAKQDVFMSNRRLDAEKMLLQYKDLGFVLDEVKSLEIPQNLPVKSVMIFTNNMLPNNEFSGDVFSDDIVDDAGDMSAITYFNQNKNQIIKWSEKYNCDVYIIHGNYWDDYQWELLKR